MASSHNREVCRAEILNTNVGVSMHVSLKLRVAFHTGGGQAEDVGKQVLDVDVDVDVTSAFTFCHCGNLADVPPGCTLHAGHQACAPNQKKISRYSISDVPATLPPGDYATTARAPPNATFARPYDAFIGAIRVSTQTTLRQNFDMRPGKDWTIFLMLSIGCHFKFDAACASKF